MKAILDYLGFVLAILVLTAISLIVFMRPGYAQASGAAQCAPLASVMAQLSDQWKEVPVGRGLAAGGCSVLMLFADPEGVTWTILVVRPDGEACLLASVTNWETVVPPLPGTEV